MSHLYDLFTPLLVRDLALEQREESPVEDEENGQAAATRWPVSPTTAVRPVAPVRVPLEVDSVSRREAAGSAGA